MKFKPKNQMPIIVPKTFKPKLFQPTINSDKFHYSPQALTLQPNKKNCIISLFAQTFRKFSRKMSVKLYSSFFFLRSFIGFPFMFIFSSYLFGKHFASILANIWLNSICEVLQKMLQESSEEYFDGGN